MKYRLSHQDLPQALALSGHGSQIWIADATYPDFAGAPARATQVQLNLAHRIVSSTDKLAVLLDAVPIEAARAMLQDNDEEARIVQDHLVSRSGNNLSNSRGCPRAKVASRRPKSQRDRSLIVQGTNGTRY